MPAAAKKYVTQEHHDALAAKVASSATTIERLSVRVEVISHDTTHLLQEVAAIREEMVTRAELHEALGAVREGLHGELRETRDEILRVIEEKHTVLLSAIIQLGKKAP
jgi:hypothetical protein